MKKIAMFTNTYAPLVGGVAQSVQQFVREFRATGHRVLVVAPQFEQTLPDESGVVRIPAVQRFNGSDFSVPVPVSGELNDKLDAFKPDLIHSHHPFLLGHTAHRVASAREIPIVFTHHTRYEKYTHYVPGDSETMRRFVVELAAGYANLCDAVIAPSPAIAEGMRNHGVTQPVHEIPSGVETSLFERGDGGSARRKLGIPSTAFVVGYVGRLASEKGLKFLADCVAAFLRRTPNTYFICAGKGPSESMIRNAFRLHGVGNHLVLPGNLPRHELSDVVHAMDVFAFSSQCESETLSPTEAMAASKPVVAVNAPGVSELVLDQKNGLLVPPGDANRFVEALCQVHDATPTVYMRWAEAAKATAREWSCEIMAERTLRLYDACLQAERRPEGAQDRWSDAMKRVEEEWKIWSNMVDAAGHAILGPDYHIF